MIVLLALAACDSGTDSVPATVYAGPEMEHTPPASPSEGEDVALSVTATDIDGVASVRVYYRSGTATAFSPAAMEVDGDTWSVTIPGTSVDDPALEYYFEAADLGDPSTESLLPEEGEREPFSVAVNVVGLAVPFVEDFEPGDGESERLSSLGWANASQGFTGYGWELSTARTHAGAYSVGHGRGIADIDPLDDWLISPAIDLGAAPSAQVTWYEYGASVDEASHTLMVSTGSRDPADGEYTALSNPLPAPTDGEWARSAAYDLSAYTGQVIYLAWHYVGQDADDWYIDDVAVTELGADLVASLATSPEVVRPGESGVLTVSVTNTSSVSASDVSVSVELPDGGASFTSSSQLVGEIAAGASGTADFDYTVGGTTSDNRYLPLTVTVSSSGDPVVLDDQLLVGRASSASFTFDNLATGSVRVSVGVGDLDAPDYELEVFAGEAAEGETTYTADITDAYASLPPAAGALRWWLRVDTAEGGTVTDFAINYDATDYVSTDTPSAVASDNEGVIYLPEPPAPTILDVTSTPDALDPGSTGVTLAIDLYNAGADGSGPLVATLASTHVDLTVLDGGPVTLDPGVFEADEVLNVSGLFSVEVSTAHTDSEPVTAELTLTDGVDSWTEEVSLAVPFPVAKITGIEIDDDGRDGILDPDESAEFTFRVTNTGDESMSGQVVGTLGIGASSTASATAGTNSESVGTLGVGDTEIVDDFEVMVTGGAAGDTVVLELTLVDNLRSYVALFPLTLGERPFVSMSDLDDPLGDVVNGDGFDVLNGTWRVDGDNLELRLQSDTVFDASTLFVEAWGESSGADYDLYILVAQSGVGSLRGYSFATSSFTTLADPVVSYPDASTVQIDVSITALGLSFDSFTLGFGVGWCGEPDYYCDHFPDGWGYPYSGYDPSGWYELSW